mgnify:CR=1 FL=1
MQRKKNNTISIKYIHDNIDKFYPHGRTCTSRSAITGNKLALNRAGALATGDDSNEYYVAGDINLEWIGYAEIAADVILTVVTLGGSAFVSGGLKGIRATKTMRDLSKSLGALRKLDSVRDYIKTYEDCEATFKYLNDIGINVIQISGIGPIPADKVAYLVENGICPGGIAADLTKPTRIYSRAATAFWIN